LFSLQCFAYLFLFDFFRRDFNDLSVLNRKYVFPVQTYLAALRRSCVALMPRMQPVLEALQAVSSPALLRCYSRTVEKRLQKRFDGVAHACCCCA